MGRILIYISIIHTDPDLGSLASDVEEKAVGLLGERWGEHKKVVEQYWKEIAKYFENRNIKDMKIFQDGLPVGGRAGQEMIDELAKTGSPNYGLLKNLSKRGAKLLKTEDPELLKQEYQITKDLVGRKNLISAIFAFLNYKLRKGRLLEVRDKYIAKQINQELGKGETGICFLGAYHQVLPKLAKDIKVVLFKNPDRVKEYYQALSSSGKGWVIKSLARYLIKPVEP